MTDDQKRPLGLADAYAVETPDDNRALYRDWATSYEADFIEPRGYVYHLRVAELYAQRELGGAVLDVGCGTGIVGVALSERSITTIDGIDISPEMLIEAEAKGVYRSLSEVDVTERMPIDDGAYAGVISVGTFTHGHLGPEPLHELVRVVRSGGLLAIGINAEHYEEHGFAAVLDEMLEAGTIRDRRLEEVRMYKAADDQWANDVALVALLTRS